MSTPAARLREDLRAAAQADTHTTAPDVWASAVRERAIARTGGGTAHWPRGRARVRVRAPPPLPPVDL